MKSVDLHILIKGLGKSDLDRIALYLSAGDQVKIVGPLFETLRSMMVFSEEEIERKLQISGKTLTRRVNLLAGLIFEAFGQMYGDLKLENLAEAAKRFTMIAKNELANSVLSLAFNIAMQFERFDVMVNLWSLVEILPQRITLKGYSEIEAVEKQKVLLIYKALDSRLRSLNDPACDVQDRKRFIDEVGYELSVMPTDFMGSKRIECMHHKVYASLKIFQREFEDALISQRKLVGLIQEHSWAVENVDFILVRQYSKLLLLLQLTGRDSEAKRALIDSPINSTSLPRVEVERLFTFYFQRLELAIQIEDRDNGYAIVEAYISSLHIVKEIQAKPDVALHLYSAAYFYFLHSDWDKAKEVLHELQQIPRSDFEQKTLPMVRLLSLLLDLELGDLEFAETKLLNLRKASFYRESKYFKMVLRHIARLIRSGNTQQSEALNDFLAEYQNCRKRRECEVYDNYFDMMAWIQSKLSQRSMAYFASNRQEGMMQKRG